MKYGVKGTELQENQVELCIMDHIKQRHSKMLVFKQREDFQIQACSILNDLLTGDASYSPVKKKPENHLDKGENKWQ